MILYGLKNCDTCRKVLKLLPETEFKDVRMDGVPAEILTLAHERFKDRLVNTRSTTWRELSAEERLSNPLELLSENPTLMKRPLIVDEDNMYLGWDREVQTQLLG